MARTFSLRSNSLAPILPLAAGPAAYIRTIGTPHQAVFDRGLQLLLERRDLDQIG